MWRILDRVEKRKATFSDIDLLSDVIKTNVRATTNRIAHLREGFINMKVAVNAQGLLRHFRKDIESRCREEPIIKKKLNNPYLVDQHLLENKNA